MRLFVSPLLGAASIWLLAGAPAASGQTAKTDPGNVKPAESHEVEGYSGKLLANDVSFALHLNSDHTAAADWVASPEKTCHLKGTYTGAEGVYVVTLKRDSGGNPLGAQTLTLFLRRMGGMEPGQFTADASHAKRTIAELQLTSIEGYKAKPGKVGQNVQRARAGNARRGQANLNRRRAGGRRTTRTRPPNQP